MHKNFNCIFDPTYSKYKPTLSDNDNDGGRLHSEIGTNNEICLTRRLNDSLLNPVISKKELSSACMYNFCQDDSLGKCSADLVNLCLFLVELYSNINEYTNNTVKNLFLLFLEMIFM